MDEYNDDDYREQDYCNKHCERNQIVCTCDNCMRDITADEEYYIFDDTFICEDCLTDYIQEHKHRGDE